ncbi:MAG: hypothetical protein JXQ91_02210 [Vannielia sp.]|uniref:hypothetical protein n=1 Tax=Vannielia sp. TaxID=2813045 RepID=UPI003B8C7F26
MATLRAIPLLVLLLLALPARAEELCFTPPHDQLCATYPEDQRDFSALFEYRVIAGAAQDPFDTFSWQAFTALNWPDTARPGAAPASWRGFARKAQAPGPCGPRPPGTVLATPLQSDGNALIDRNARFITYETRLNPVAAAYLATLPPYTDVNFPRGESTARPASVLLKTAWRILPAPDPAYITAPGAIEIPAHMRPDGVPACAEARLGLVGMHIVTKVASGHGDHWLWSTFEHVALAPEAENAREINSLYANPLFPEGCRGPAEAPGDWLLYNPATPHAPANAPPASALWHDTAPMARSPSGSALPPTQVLRCWAIFGPTRATNARWQARHAGTPLARYQLISTQWRGANPDPIFPEGELPRYLSNLTLETYVQTAPNGSCLSCHAAATTRAGAPSDFTFLLQD